MKTIEELKVYLNKRIDESDEIIENEESDDYDLEQEQGVNDTLHEILMFIEDKLKG